MGDESTWSRAGAMVSPPLTIKPLGGNNGSAAEEGLLQEGQQCHLTSHDKNGGERSHHTFSRTRTHNVFLK